MQDRLTQLCAWQGGIYSRPGDGCPGESRKAIFQPLSPQIFLVSTKTTIWYKSTTPQGAMKTKIRAGGELLYTEG